MLPLASSTLSSLSEMRNLKAECRADPDSLAGDRLDQRFCETTFPGKGAGRGGARAPFLQLLFDYFLKQL